jgi:AraC-like DNA-binding protein
MWIQVNIVTSQPLAFNAGAEYYLDNTPQAMIEGTRIMIAGCIDRKGRDACGGCERRDTCGSWWRMLRFDPPVARIAGPRFDQAGSAGSNPLLLLLGEIAKAFDGAGGPAPPVRRRADCRNPPPPGSLRLQIEALLEPMLAKGEVRIDRIARELGYSRQTLYRRLKMEGITFHRLLDEFRHRLAIRLMREQGFSVKETAYCLGFSDPAAFSRAFKRWTGSSPTRSSK